MLFEEIGTKDQVIDRLVETRGYAEEVELSFTGTGTAEVKLKIIFPNLKIDEEGDEDLNFDELSQEEIDECYNYEEYKDSKRSKASEKYYKNTMSMFRDTAMDGADSPLQHFYNEVIGDVNKFVQALRVKPHHQQQQLLDAYQDGETNIACRSGQGPGKCSKADNILIDRNLGRIRVGDSEGKKLRLLSLNESSGKMEWKTSTCNKNLVKNCHEISTRSGNTLTMSSDHPVYTQRGWVNAGEVMPGDLMVNPRGNFDLKDDESISEDDAYLLGAMIGDGGTSKETGAKFSQPDNTVLEEVTRIIRSKGGEVKKHRKYTYGISKMLPFFREHDLMEKKSVDKNVPASIYTNGKRGVRKFLQGLFDCDGYRTKDGFGICLSSRRLIEDVQFLLEALNIPTNIKYKRSKCNGKYFDAWRLEICGSENLHNWMEEIGDLKEREPLPQSLLSRTSNSNDDIVPIKIEQWKEIAEEQGVKIASYRKKGFRARKDSYLTRKKFNEFCEEFNYTGKYSHLANSDMRWTLVEAVEDKGRIQTYDISVEDNHNYVCNNLVVHNTFVSCIIWLHWLLSNPYGLLVVTAPTMRQCKDVWLAQARQMIQEADPRIKAAYEFTNTGIKMFGHKASDWGAYLATASKPENFQGIHRERLGIHCEEASGLDRTIIETIQGTLSNAEGTYLWLQIGNPNTRDCAFYECFFGIASKNWHTLHWNGEETPETPFFSQRRNKEVADEHGRDSDVYRVRVLGEFPSLDPSSMVSLEDLIACTKSDVLITATKINARARAQGKLRRHLGIDLARFGGDENTIVPFEGNIQLRHVEAHSRIDPNDAIDRAVLIQNELDWDNKDTLYIIDTSGMGEAAVGRVGQKKRMGKRVHEFYSQNSANDGTKYANKITEAWCLFCKAVRKKEIYLKYDKKTFDQLSKRRYSVDKRGRIKIESKDDYKKRQKGGDVGELGKSPDRADCCLMSFFPIAEESTRIAAYEA